MAVITDVDNTLYNFVDYFAPAFRAMVHILARNTSISEDSLMDSFRSVYSKYQSLEYPNSVQQLSVLLERYGEEEIKQLVYLARVAFWHSAKRRLQPYEGVRETLLWLKRQNYALVAYSDGPLRRVAWKLSRLGIRRYFDLIVAWVPDRHGLPDFEGDERRWFTSVNQTSNNDERLRVISVSAANLKPNPKLLCQILADYKLESQACFMVGDSIAKDLVPARVSGIHDVWARYGKIFQKENWDTLVRISPWHDATVRTEEKNIAVIEPLFTIDRFEQLKQIAVHQFDLFEG